MSRVLLVCTGNIIRSACAKAYLQKHYHDQCPDWEIDSAGTHALDKQSIDPNVGAILKEQGIDASDHQSKPVSTELIQASNIIIVMEAIHYQLIKQNYPISCGKLFMFDESKEILDPIGQPQANYRDVVYQIQQGTRQWAGKLNYLI